jgi:hypothetical protein
MFCESGDYYYLLHFLIYLLTITCIPVIKSACRLFLFDVQIVMITI